MIRFTRIRYSGTNLGVLPGLVCAIALAACAGCQKRGEAEPFGKTFYVGGASNLDAFNNGVADGLRAAGYRGDVEAFIWTVSFNPLIDQLVTINAKARATLLAREIEDYQRRYPGNRVNVIALSAGTGVAVWALEDLKPSVKINALVLLGSSLSHSYDVRRALQHVDDKIYVYHSPHDSVLEAVRFVGTIDGQRGTDSAGQVGLRVPPGAQDKIVNTPWSRSYMRYGWAGGHTDCINERFIRGVVAPLLVRRETAVTDASSTSSIPVRLTNGNSISSDVRTANNVDPTKTRYHSTAGTATGEPLPSADDRRAASNMR